MSCALLPALLGFKTDGEPFPAAEKSDLRDGAHGADAALIAHQERGALPFGSME
jgi:hypothetical protein